MKVMDQIFAKVGKMQIDCLAVHSLIFHPKLLMRQVRVFCFIRYPAMAVPKQKKW
jgi:hypothetical protein